MQLCPVFLNKYLHILSYNLSILQHNLNKTLLSNMHVNGHAAANSLLLIAYLAPLHFQVVPWIYITTAPLLNMPDHSSAYSGRYSKCVLLYLIEYTHLSKQFVPHGIVFSLQSINHFLSTLLHVPAVPQSHQQSAHHIVPLRATAGQNSFQLHQCGTVL